MSDPLQPVPVETGFVQDASFPSNSFNRQTLEALGRKTGFDPVRTSLSDDGGNLTCVFRSTAAAQEKEQEPPSP